VTQPKTKIVDSAAREVDNALVEQFGTPVLNSDGQPICGEKAKDTGSPCLKIAGWGTKHLGFGPCKDHGGEDKRHIMMFEDPPMSGSYSLVIKNQELRDIIHQEELSGEVDRLDDEILLARSMIKYLVGHFEGVETYEKTDDDGNVTTHMSLERAHGEVRELAKLINLLSDTIEAKYRVMQIAGNIVSRDVVSAYIQQVIAVLDRTLRNTCMYCKRTTNQRDQAITALDSIGGI
jgi:hypothetical protein